MNKKGYFGTFEVMALAMGVFMTLGLGTIRQQTGKNSLREMLNDPLTDQEVPMNRTNGGNFGSGYMK